MSKTVIIAHCCIQYLIKKESAPLSCFPALLSDTLSPGQEQGYFNGRPCPSQESGST